MRYEKYSVSSSRDVFIRMTLPLLHEQSHLHCEL